MSEWLNFLGWTFLPGLATNWLQNIYYKLSYPVGDNNIPKPGQRKYVLHRRRIYILVVLAYLSYTIFEVIRSIPPNYYDLLEVDQDFTVKELKSNMRRLQLAYHPDRNPDQRAESIFILLREAYDTLTDPKKRFAYDRFGPDIKTWTNCQTIRDYISIGKNYSTGFYMGTGLVLFILNVLGKGQFGRFWRFVVFLGMACIEASLILHPTKSIILSYILTNFAIFEQIQIFRQLFVTMFIALSQVGPVLFPSNDSDDIRPSLCDLEFLTNINIEETKSILKSSYNPFQSDQNAQKELNSKMKNLLVENYLFENDPEFAQVYNRVRQRVSKRNHNKK